MQDLNEAIAASNLRGLPPTAIEALTADARRVDVPAGTTYRHVGDDSAHIELVVSGFVRIFVTAPDGRSLTIRYARPGALMGVWSLYGTGQSMPGSIQALVDTELLVLEPGTVRRLATMDLAVAGALLVELSERVWSFVNEIPWSAFGSVRQRVAQHLLDLASERQRDRDLMAPVTQQQLAEAVGSVREVVVRVLRELRQEGAIQTVPGGIVILDPDCLLADSDAGTKVPDGRTTGSPRSD